MPRETATGSVVEGHLTPVAEGVSKAVRGGLVMSHKGLALLHKPVMGEKQADTHRAATFMAMLRGAKDTQRDAALRGIVDDDGDKFTLYVDETTKEAYTAAGKGRKATKVPPFVYDAVHEGMSFQAARQRLTDMRAIRDGFESGRPEFNPTAKTGWHPLVTMANLAKKAKAKQDAAMNNRALMTAVMNDVQVKLEIPFEEADGSPHTLTKAEFEKIQAEARKTIAERKDEAETTDWTKSIERNRDRVIKAQGWEKARAVAEAILELTGDHKHPKKPPEAEPEPTASKADQAIVDAIKQASGSRRGRKTHTGKIAAVH